MNRVKNIRRNAAQFQRAGVRPARRVTPRPSPAPEVIAEVGPEYTPVEPIPAAVVAEAIGQALDIVDFTAMTREQLRTAAKDLGVVGFGRMLKPDLLAAVIEASQAARLAA